MPKPNYQFEKRQKELEKKKKQEQKRLRKLAGNPVADEDAAGPSTPVETDNADTTSTQ